MKSVSKALSEKASVALQVVIFLSLPIQTSNTIPTSAQFGTFNVQYSEVQYGTFIVPLEVVHWKCLSRDRCIIPSPNAGSNDQLGFPSTLFEDLGFPFSPVLQARFQTIPQAPPISPLRSHIQPMFQYFLLSAA